MNGFATTLARLALLPLMLCGCATTESPTARDEVARQVAEENRTPSDPRVEAMRPMFGMWAVDLDATLVENEHLPDDVREKIRKDLTDYPFELEITDHDYISQSSIKTIADHYVVRRVDGDVVIITLSSADGGERREGREARLQLRVGRLLINNGALVMVMSRPAATK